MTASLDLYCLEGPLQGERTALSPTVPLRIGRSKRGLHLADPLVSIDHAEISWTTDRYYITDFGSASGTFLDERRLGSEPVALLPGSLLKIGESIFRVEVRQERPGWFYPVAFGLAGVAIVLFLVALLAMRPMAYEPVIRLRAPANLGNATSSEMAVPTSFIREHGIDHRDVEVRRVTDYDQDGVDEVWLLAPGRQIVVTFEPDGAWRVIGELPLGCYDRPGVDFPDQRCDGELYFHERGRYRRVAQDGVVAWIRLPGANIGDDPGLPRPYRVTLVDLERLAGFLESRGVSERVHYVICEAAIPGVAAQAVGQSGKVHALEPGCLQDLNLGGSNLFEDFGGERPIAVAFTAAGRQMLVDDVRTFLSGSTDGFYLDRHGPLVAAMSEAPQPRVSLRLAFSGYDVPVDPVADDRELEGPRALVASHDGAAAPAVVTTLIDASRVTLDPPGCSELEVTTADWHCVMARLCMPSDTFLVVRQVGCGRNEVVLTTPYGGSTMAGLDPDIEVRAKTDSRIGGTQVDVLRARVSYRLRPTTEANGVAAGDEKRP